MPRPIQALIHVAALQQNLSSLRASAPDARVWAVVKANAYGHGIERVFDALRAADGFAVLDVSEAERLRALGWRGPVLLLEGVFEPRDLEWCSRLQLWHTVHGEEQIDWLSRHKTQQPHRVFLKLNSGMNRLGFSATRFRSAWARLDALSQVDEISLMTHFSDADGARGVEHQLALFNQLSTDLPGERCISNSAAVLRHGLATQMHSDWIRPGIALYGAAPDYPEHDADHWALQPTMSLRSRLIAIQHLNPGDTVGYGSTFTASTAMTIGVVACGYADGYPRSAPRGTPVLVNGQRVPLVGRVSMDMLTVDLTPLMSAGSPCGVGAEVTLWGRASTGEQLDVDEVAHRAGTIAYELLCALALRVPVEVA